MSKHVISWELRSWGLCNLILNGAEEPLPDHLVVHVFKLAGFIVCFAVVKLYRTLL